MDRWVNPPKRVTSLTWGPSPPCKKALSHWKRISGDAHFLPTLFSDILLIISRLIVPSLMRSCDVRIFEIFGSSSFTLQRWTPFSFLQTFNSINPTVLEKLFSKHSCVFQQKRIKLDGVLEFSAFPLSLGKCKWDHLTGLY